MLVLVIACSEAPAPTEEPSLAPSGSGPTAALPTGSAVAIAGPTIAEPTAAATPAVATPPAAPRATTVPALAELLGAAGTIVVADVVPGTVDGWSLTLRFVRPPDRTIETRTVRFAVPDGWIPRERTTASVSTDGWAAIELNSIEDRDIEDDGLMVLDLLGGRTSGAILACAPMWLPDGTLLVTTSVRIRQVLREVARRIPAHGLGQPLDLVIPDGPPWPMFPGHYVVHGDLSGLQAYDLKDRRPADPYLLRWNGKVVDRDRADAPHFVYGDERYAGARGEAISGCPLGTCPARWYRADGTSLALPFQPWASAWTRDGRSWVALDGSTLHRIRDTGARLVDRVIGPVPPGGLEGDTIEITGMSDAAAVIEGDDEKVTIVPLDGSPPIGPLMGTLAAVNP